MNFLLGKRVGTAIVVVALAAVLIGLAILQYRWSVEASEAATQRMEAALHASLSNFREDLSREFAAICLELEPGSTDVSREGKRISERLLHWRRTAAHPALVADVYVWQEIPGGKDTLRRLDSQTGQLQPIDWPSQYRELHQRLQKAIAVLGPIHANLTRYQKFHQEFHTGSPEAGFEYKSFGGTLHFQRVEPTPKQSAGSDILPGDPSAPWFFDQSVPALIHPIHLNQERNRTDADASHVMTWIMVSLNKQALEQHILPELSQRYFAAPGGLDYKVAVVSGSGKVVYSSDAGFATGAETDPDAALNLFGPPFLPDQPGIGMSLFVSPPSTARVGPFIGFLHDAGPLHIEPVPFASSDPNWQLVVKHRKGSVEAAVASLRRRNLTVSFGVLLVLALTMGLVIITAQRAHRLAQLQMDFVTGVSHELRTPLAVISSAAENIADGVVTNERQLTRYANVIKNQSKQLIQLVEQVLLFAATRQSRQQYNLSPVEIAELIDTVCENTASLTKKAGISVERRIQSTLPPVKADFPALSQCLQNLVTNAVKYGGNGQWIGISAYTASESNSSSELRITVQDRGIGIDTDAMRHIFEPFYRSPSAAGSQIRGTGLGLTLAKGMVEAMGGRLTVLSEAGKGAAFTIHLPLPVQADSARERVIEISANPKFTS